MNKTELISAIAEKTGMTKKNVKEVLEATQEVVFSTIKDEEVKLMDGVTISAKVVPERTARNPQTGEEIVVPEHMAPKCKFGTAIKNAVNA